MIEQVASTFETVESRDVRNLILSILLSLYAAVVIRTAWVAEDAYITFRTIAIFLAHKGLTFNVGERVQAFTHPLWLFVMSGAYYVTRDFFYTSIAVSLLLALVTAAILALRLAQSMTAAVLGLVVLILSKAYIDYSTSGLENSLTHLIVVVFLVLLFKAGMTNRRLFFLTLMASLGTLSRPDSILVFIPSLVYCLWLLRGRKAVGALALGLIPILLWEAFSLFYYGFPFPNTAYAKLTSGIGAVELAQQGMFYLLSSLDLDPITLVAVTSGVALAFFDRKPRHLLVALGILAYLAYVVRIGGDWMTGRFLTLPLIAAVGILTHRRIPASLPFLAALAGIAVLGVFSPRPTLTSGVDYGSNITSALDRWGVFDERARDYSGAGLLRSKRYLSMPNNDRMSAGIAARDSGEKVVARPDIGYFGYYAGRGVHVVDTLGLGDPLLARLTPQTKPYWIMAQFTRFVPPGYLETIASGRNEIENPELAAYYDKLSFVISGPLFDPRRLVEIIRFNLGQYDHLIAAYEDSRLLHIAIKDIQDLSSTAAPRDPAGYIEFPKQGVKIALGQVTHARHVLIGLDDRSPYVLVFSKDGREITRQLSEGNYSLGMESRTIGLSAAAAAEGYDTLTILPGSGTETYVLGELKFLQ
jgi:arabinofuranosyltransferase